MGLVEAAQVGQEPGDHPECEVLVAALQLVAHRVGRLRCGQPGSLTSTIHASSAADD
jgi:hypothetical protein